MKNLLYGGRIASGPISIFGAEWGMQFFNTKLYLMVISRKIAASPIATEIQGT
jgi:hypothetical protein